MIPEPSEHQSQAAVVEWATAARAMYPALRLLYSPTNGTHRNFRQTAKLKAEGMRNGVADLVLPVARCGFHQLFIEMKKRKGVQSDEQKEFERLVTAEGNAYWLARSSDEAIEVLERYLKGTMK